MDTEIKNYTWADLKAIEPGTVLKDWEVGNLRCLIVRGPGSLCACIGMKEGHPCYGRNYDDMPCSVHGGWTFGAMGDGKYHPEGYYWAGWDYAHYQDFTFYDFTSLTSDADTKWFPDMVEYEVNELAKEMIALYPV